MVSQSLFSVNPRQAAASVRKLAGQVGLYPKERIGVVPSCEERIGVVPVQNKHQGIKYMDGLRTCSSVGGGGGGGGGVWMPGACKNGNRDVS